MSAPSALTRVATQAATRPYAETVGAVLDYVGAPGRRGAAWWWRARRLRADIQAWRTLEYALRKDDHVLVSLTLARLAALRAQVPETPGPAGGELSATPGLEE